MSEASPIRGGRDGTPGGWPEPASGGGAAPWPAARRPGPGAFLRNHGHGPAMNDMAQPSARPSSGVRPAPSYWAFLSYSHRDSKLAGWLHAALERYRVPKGLVGRVTAGGPVPARLTPIFRDRSELAAADDLGAEIRGALATSRFLIVLCSPAAAASRWTDAEIAEFKRLHPDGRVFAAIAAGEPFASDIPGREAEECFPHALRYRFGTDGQPTGERAEPIAADFREGGDGRRLGLLKLVAGMLGVGLDELARREAQRRQKRLAWLAAASLAGMAVTSGLAVAAIEARDEARDQRAEAEGLIGFMLGDLRAKLEPVGRLDALDAVGAKALSYYQRQDEGGLADASLLQRARALTLIGEIANRRGDLDGALKRYREALAATGEALQRAPEDEQRVFDHAQNVYWVGYIAWQRGQTGDAEVRWQEYKQLANRLIELNPNKPEWRIESVYADTNLGLLLLEGRQFARAAAIFNATLRDARSLAEAEPGNRQYQDIVAETLAYLADAQRDEGKLNNAMATRQRQLAYLASIAASHGGDVDVKRKTMVARSALGHLYAAQGDTSAGLDQFRQAISIAHELQRVEPDNTEWLLVASSAQADLADLLLAVGNSAAAAPLIRTSCDIARRLQARDSNVVKWRFQRTGECLRLRAAAAAARGHRSEALAIAQQAASLEARHLGIARRGPALSAGAAGLLAGDQLAALGDEVAARAQWKSALTALSGHDLPPATDSRRYALLKRLGRTREAAVIAVRLDVIGYRHPTYLQEKRSP
jgi:eukaryotic-like serine/threonine-protein kinase